MGITFDHVEGVVQKQGESGSAPSGGGGAPAKQKPAESPEAEQRRRDRLAHRLHAD